MEAGPCLPKRKKKPGDATMIFKAPLIYEELGIPRVINAFEAITLYGGSVIYPEVSEAMAKASEGFYNIPALNRAISNKIARLTNNQAAFITCGTSASLALVSAACIAGESSILREALPLNANPSPIFDSARSRAYAIKDEIILFRCQRNPYDRALRLAGSKIVEIGYPTHKAERHQFEDAISEKTAAIFYFAGAIFERYALRIEDTAEIAKAHNIPLIVDGAAQIPPKENLWRYTQRGATLALFSGGKGIRGPQNTGLIVGDPKLIKDIENIAAPYQTFGRPMKTSKEAMIGLLKAIEILLSEDYSAKYESMKIRLSKMIEEIKSNVIEHSYLLDTGRHGQQYPRAVFVLNDKSVGARELFMKGLMENGDPPVLVGPLDENERAFYVNPFGFQDDEEYELVAKRILEECGRYKKNGKT
jgi:L-seryl-tRNA(Ser) seleniumtransferase